MPKGLELSLGREAQRLHSRSQGGDIGVNGGEELRKDVGLEVAGFKRGEGKGDQSRVVRKGCRHEPGAPITLNSD